MFNVVNSSSSLRLRQAEYPQSNEGQVVNVPSFRGNDYERTETQDNFNGKTKKHTARNVSIGGAIALLVTLICAKTHGGTILEKAGKKDAGFGEKLETGLKNLFKNSDDTDIVKNFKEKEKKAKEEAEKLKEEARKKAEEARRKQVEDISNITASGEFNGVEDLTDEQFELLKELYQVDTNMTKDKFKNYIKDKKNYNKMAISLHPDKYQGEPQEVQDFYSNLFVILNNLKNK